MIDAPPGGSVSGPVLFARYAYPPNRLGLCGPADAPALIDGALVGAERHVRQLALGFEGAFPYLRLIAEENGIADPLDRAVVEAYWLGNDLSARVRARALHRNVVDRFRARVAPKDWRWLEASIASGSRPIHAFHVLEVFPRIGLLRGGVTDGVLATMDACRIRWGRVTGIDGVRLTVSVRPLTLVSGRLALAAPQTESVTAWADADGPLGGIKVAEWISVHWAWACDRLSALQVTNLAAWTERAITLANRSV